MLKKIKEFSKKYLLGFTLGMLSAGIVSVAAAAVFPSNQTTYDNSVSGLSSTNVQGAIDELYTTCFPPKTGGDAILDDTNIVTSGDGLYEDEYEDGKYTYKGANPNNYVTFNNEKAGWRIISINSDGTIKIIKDTSIGNIVFDTSRSNDWNRPASLNTYLNSTYYNSLTSTAQSQIVTATYYTGTIKVNNNDMQAQINDEKSSKWNGKIALITLSEYIRSGSNINCKTYSTYSPKYSTCKNSIWMINDDYWWTLTPYPDMSYMVFMINGNIGPIGYTSVSDQLYNAVRPVVTLSSSVQITGGDGSKSNPYTIK